MPHKQTRLLAKGYILNMDQHLVPTGIKELFTRDTALNWIMSQVVFP